MIYPRVWATFVAAIVSLWLVPAAAVPPAYHDGPAPQVPPFKPTLPVGVIGAAPLQPALVGTPTTSVGTLPVLVILVDFSDAPAVAPTNDPAYFQDMLFADDAALVSDTTLHGDGLYPYQSLATWYDVESAGRLQLEGTVVGWWRAPNPRSFYARKNDNQQNGRFGLGNGFSLDSIQRGGSTVLVGEALAAAVTEFGIDLGDFDWNGDGIVDAVMLVHAGAGAEMSGIDDDLWSFHNQDNYTVAGEDWEVRFVVAPERFLCPEGLCATATDFPTGIGVYAHEFGHVLGLPDLNDTVSGRGIGDYGLMGWGLFQRDGFIAEDFGPDTAPIGMGLWSLERLGWVAPEVVTANSCGIELAPAQSTRQVKRMDLNDSEYFLVGYTPKTGHYAGLPDRGVQILHIDTDEVALSDLSNNQRNVCIPDRAGDCATERHYAVSIKQADGRFDLERGNNFGDSGDLFDFGDALVSGSVPSSCPWDGVPCRAAVRMRGLVGGKARVNLIVDTAAVPDAPAFARVPPTNAEVGALYTYAPSLNAGAGDAVTFTVVGPAGMVVDAASGVVTWTPAVPGRFDATLIAENCGGDTSQSWTIQVTASRGGCGAAPVGSGPAWPGVAVVAAALWWGRRRGRRKAKKKGRPPAEPPLFFSLGDV